MRRIFLAAAAGLGMSGQADATTYTANFVGGVWYSTVDGYQMRGPNVSFTFESPTFKNVNFSSSYYVCMVDDPCRDYQYYSYGVKTNEFGQLTSISYVYDESYSEEYLGIYGNGGFLYWVDRYLYEGPGKWTISAVPIPASLPLLGTALAGVGVMACRRRKSA